MNNPGLFQSRWNLGRRVLCNVVPLALLTFWLWPTGHMLCVIFDEWLFRSLNAPLDSNPIWLHIRAIASLRPFDVVTGLILPTLLVKDHRGISRLMCATPAGGVAMGWGYYTPFAFHAANFWLKVTAPTSGLLARLPLISRMNVVSGAN